MARRPRITQAAVAKLGAERLAALLVSEAGKHKGLKQALQLALEADQGTDSLAAGITQRLVSIGRSQSRLSTNKGREMVAELKQLRASIVDDVARSDPAEALSLLWQLIDLHPSLIERTRDRAGRLPEFFSSTVPHLPELAALEKPESEQIAETIYQHLLENHYGIYDDLIRLLAEPLGEPGLIILRDKFAAAQAEHQKTNRRFVGRNATIWQDGLRDVADAMGNADAFIKTFTPEEMQHPGIATQIAARLVDADRAGEAITILDHAEADEEDRPEVRLEWATVRCRALAMVGRTEELKTLHHATFETFLSQDHLRSYLKLLPDFDDVEAEERALDRLSAHPSFLAALLFLVRWPAPHRAAQLVITRADELDGSQYELLLPAAEALDGRFPLAGILIRRALIDAGLKLGRAHRFKQLMRHIKELEALDAAVKDYDGQETHQAYMERLWLDHPHKAAFWDLLE